MGLCLTATGVVVALGIDAMTLAWDHSVQKIRWEEDWQQKGSTLVLTQARVRGSGAGMEPPPQARLHNGVWTWRPPIAPQAHVVLRRSGATADWRLCWEGHCQPLSAFVPLRVDPVVLQPCDSSSANAGAPFIAVPY